MALAIDFLGAQKDYFQKASWQLYCDASGAYQYVGKCENEIEVDMGIENMEWFDNGSGVQTLYILTQSKIDPKINFSFSQAFEPSVTGLVYNCDMDVSDATWAYNFFGSNPADYSYYGWKFVSKSLSGLVAEIYVRKGVCVANGAWTSGAPGAFGVIPATVRMTQDTDITNTLRDLGYIRLQKRSNS